jgi:hypothetical protein
MALCRIKWLSKKKKTKKKKKKSVVGLEPEANTAGRHRPVRPSERPVVDF